MNDRQHLPLWRYWALPVVGLAVSVLMLASGQWQGWVTLGLTVFIAAGVWRYLHPRTPTALMVPLVLLVAVAMLSLSLSACSPSYPRVAHNPLNTELVTIHDGGNITDNCVFDLLATGATIVTTAAAPDIGAVFVIAGWTLAGWSLASTVTNCWGSWNSSVGGDLVGRKLIHDCMEWNDNPGTWDNCVVANIVLLQAVAMGALIGVTLVN
jgi:hypothetical protein